MRDICRRSKNASVGIVWNSVGVFLLEEGRLVANSDDDNSISVDIRSLLLLPIMCDNLLESRCRTPFLNGSKLPLLQSTLLLAAMDRWFILEHCVDSGTTLRNVGEGGANPTTIPERLHSRRAERTTTFDFDAAMLINNTGTLPLAVIL